MPYLILINFANFKLGKFLCLNYKWMPRKKFENDIGTIEKL